MKKDSKSKKINSKNKINKFKPLKKEIKKRKNKKKLNLLILIFLGIALIILVIWLLFQLELINNPFQDNSNEIISFVIPDECTLILGQLIHTINDDGSCHNKCFSNCQARNLNFYSSKFNNLEQSCNYCDCECN